MIVFEETTANLCFDLAGKSEPLILEVRCPAPKGAIEAVNKRYMKTKKRGDTPHVPDALLEAWARDVFFVCVTGWNISTTRSM